MSEVAILAAVCALFSIAMMGAWLVVLRTRNGGWADVVWTFSVGATAAWAALAGGAENGRAVLAAVLIGAWSLRLGLHLVRRVAAGPEDFRYARLRDDWGRAYRSRLFWFLQLQAVCAVPLVLAVRLAASRSGPLADVADWIGVAILLVAVVGEAAADWQLSRFAMSSEARGRILDRGLWGWSRHPNFFFEWLGWCAWPVIALGPGLHVWPGGLALLAPLAMYVLLVHVTGIPPIEQRMIETRGDAFRDYQRRVSRFFPLPPRLATLPPS